MKILVVGGGGREHALVWKIAQSPLVTHLYCAPGNAGIAKLARCIDITSENIEGLLEFARKEQIDLTVVGPEAPLCKGIVNLFSEHKLRIFGPTQEGAELEGSKVFAKALIRRYGIPSPSFRAFTQSKAALAFIRTAPYPLVVKCDGLAGGKGTVICATEGEATAAVEGMMEKKIFGRAGEQILVEEHLSGIEASVMALTDGKSLRLLETSQDHKKVYDGDRGPNTGGMGAYSPASVIPEHDFSRVIREILVPIVHAMNKEKRRFKGILYAGVMFTKGGPKVLEFNARFGDPEAQPVLMRLQSDLVPLLQATVNEKLEEIDVQWDPRPAVCVVMTSAGYPNPYETGFEITGLEAAETLEDVRVFHSGTHLKDGKIVTAGGRVLGVAAYGGDIPAAQTRAYEAVKRISFKGAHYRTDIAGKAQRSISF